LVAVSIVS